MNIRLRIKNLLKRFMLIDSYCKDCGRKIDDFTVDDDFWIQIMGDDKNKEICKRCFANRMSIYYKNLKSES